MIVNPNKGLFFVATALMCSASLYGAELSTAEPDPMTRLFVGEPSRLTLPPGFPQTEAAAEPADCGLSTLGLGPAGSDRRGTDSQAKGCTPTRSEALSDPFVRAGSLGVAGAKSEIPVQPISVGSAGRLH